MNRRALFGRLAAIAAAVTLAPAVKAEAALVEALANPEPLVSEGFYGETWFLDPGPRPLPPAWVRPSSPLTFEAMAADCRARGCQLERVNTIDTLEREWLHSELRSESIWGPDVYKVLVEDAAVLSDLAGVDAWRTSLHEQARPPWQPLTTIEYVGLSHTDSGNPHQHTISAGRWSPGTPPVGHLTAWPADAPIPLGWRLLPELDGRFG